MTHFTKMIGKLIAITIIMRACLKSLLAMASVLMYVGYVQTANLFSRAGMRNEWSSSISAVLDITIEDDERVSPYVHT